jgi:uncharacterized protein YaaQ
MKLCVCIVHNRDRNRLRDELVSAGYKFTLLASQGGFLGEANATFMIGLEEDGIEALKKVIDANCCSREQVVNVSPMDAGTSSAFVPSPVRVPVGGAVVFFLPVEQFERF